MDDVDYFVRSKALDELELFKRGAKIAKDPRFFERVLGLSDDEKNALRDELRHRFKQRGWLWATIIMCSVGAVVQSVHLPWLTWS